MREILFRGKRIHDGKWVYGDYTSYCQLDRIYAHDDFQKIVWFVEVSTVSRFTGLTDKNGMKIFEGDILKSDEGNVGIVKWMPEHCAFMIYVKLENRYCYLWDNNFSKIEVIGNIHDNPELLNEVDEK